MHCYFVTALFLVSLLSFSFSLSSLLLMMPNVNKLIYTVGPLYPRVPHPRIRRTECTAPFYARALPICRFWFLQMLNIFTRALNICRFGGPGNNPPWKGQLYPFTSSSMLNSMYKYTCSKIYLYHNW